MKIKSLALFASFVFCSFSFQSVPMPTLTIEFKELKNKEADLYIAVSKPSKNFPDEANMVKQLIVKPKGKSTISISVDGLNYGAYAVMVFQDLNGNGKLDKGFMGIPNEPFAFSNNYKPVFRAPKFDDCAFQFSATNRLVAIERFIKML
jgi:uncharacterized protein (DUF2141 family)